jgi:hypothetical protein
MTSSLSFLGNSTSYLSIPNTDSFDFGTGDFTIEWYQYQTDTNSFPRIFQVGNYPTTYSIGVSIEGGNFYYWRGGLGFTLVKTLTSSEYKNKWVHFAISRSSGTTRIFQDGVVIKTMADTANFNGNNDLTIANETTRSNGAAFGGYITYFTWVKGQALYTTNFTVSNDYPSLTSDYVLLLKASSFDGTLGNTVVNSNVSTTPNVPVGFGSGGGGGEGEGGEDPPTTVIQRRASLFSNNSMVFYKVGSLASCGVGSVRNSTVKSRRI